MHRILNHSTAVAIAIGVTFAGVGVYVGMKAPLGQPDAIKTATGPVATLLTQPMMAPDGTLQNLSQWQNRKMVVNFWATWCAPCMEEMPALSALQKTLTADTVQVIGVGIDTPANIKSFVARHDVTYPVFSTGVAGTELMRQFGNTTGGLPYSVLIDEDGKILRMYLGKLDMNALQRDIMTLKTSSTTGA